MRDSKVILLTGPAGSGKTSLAERIAQNEHWVHVSEDSYWAAIKEGRPVGESRTTEEQAVVQPAVVRQVRELLAEGNHVVLEFINYENPPQPLLYYSTAFQHNQNPILIKVLRPTELAIMARKKQRGRAEDPNYTTELKHTRHQLDCLASSYIQEEWLIDNSAMSVEETYTSYFLAFLRC